MNKLYVPIAIIIAACIISFTYWKVNRYVYLTGDAQTLIVVDTQSGLSTAYMMDGYRYDDMKWMLMGGGKVTSR